MKGAIRVINSNSLPLTGLPSTKLYGWECHLGAPQTLTGLVPWPLPWVTGPVTNHPLREKSFPGVQSELPSMQLHSISSCCWSSEGDQHLLLCFPLKGVVGCDEDTPQPSFLQTEQAKCPQLLLRGLVLETFCNLGHTPPLEHCNSLMSLH